MPGTDSVRRCRRRGERVVSRWKSPPAPPPAAGRAWASRCTRGSSAPLRDPSRLRGSVARILIRRGSMPREGPGLSPQAETERPALERSAVSCHALAPFRARREEPELAGPHAPARRGEGVGPTIRRPRCRPRVRVRRDGVGDTECDFVERREELHEPLDAIGLRSTRLQVDAAQDDIQL